MTGERAAAYLRLSEMTDSTTSPERQREGVTQFIARQGWVFEPEQDLYEDWDRSAYSSRSRPGFAALVKEVEAGRYNHLVVYRMDRLARSFTQWGTIIEAAKKSECIIYSATEGINSRDASAVFGILAGMSWAESSTISTRVRAAREKQFAAGRWPGGNRPFGWAPIQHPDGVGKTLEINEVEAQHLRQAVTDILAGSSIRSICHSWNKNNIPTAAGGTWHPSRLSAIMRNPLLKGYRQERGAIVTDEQGMPIQHYPPLIDAATFAELQKTLNEKKKHPSLGGKALLAGVIICGLCRGPLMGRPGSARASYSCSTSATRGKSVCVGVSVGQTAVERVVTDVLGRMNPAQVLALLQEEVTPSDARNTLANATERYNRLLDLYEAGDINRETWVTRSAPLQEIITAAQKTIETEVKSPAERLHAAFERGDRLDTLTEIEPHRRRELLKAVFDNIIVYPAASGRGMKGIKRDERWKVLGEQRVRFTLTAAPDIECTPSEAVVMNFNPFDEDEEAVETFRYLLQKDD